jgi:hypothetical protein
MVVNGPRVAERMANPSKKLIQVNGCITRYVCHVTNRKEGESRTKKGHIYRAVETWALHWSK